MTKILPTLFELGEFHNISHHDYNIAARYIHAGERKPADVIIAPDGEPYLYRWHVVPHNKYGNVYFHLQVRSDPERPLHDHPWDNQSVILAGGYHEHYQLAPGMATLIRTCFTGGVYSRPAALAHRLVLPDDVPYTMTLFTTGPKVRKWGFWYPEGWIDADIVCRQDGRVSTHVKPGAE